MYIIVTVTAAVSLGTEQSTTTLATDLDCNSPSPNNLSSSFESNLGSSIYFTGTASSIMSRESQVSSVSVAMIEHLAGKICVDESDGV
jgi:hypothetical protein